MRLDLGRDHLDLSAQIKRLMDKDLVTVNDAVVKAGYPVQEGGPYICNDSCVRLRQSSR